MLLEIKIHEKTIQQTEWILEGIFDGFWLHFGGHFESNSLKKSIPKLNEKKDTILAGIVDRGPLTGSAGGTRFGGPGEGIWGGVMVVVMPSHG